MRSSMIVYSLIAVTFLLPGAVKADEKKDEVIARVTAAYGGDRLVNLTSVSGTNQKFVITDIRTPSPGFVETAYRDESFIFDIRNGRASNEFVFISGARSAHFRTAFDGKEGFRINYGEEYYSSASIADSYNVVGGTLRTVDAMLVWLLNQAADDAEYLGREDYQGSPHELIRFPGPRKSLLTLFINGETGIVSQMTRERTPSRTIRYVFKNHVTTDGIPYARTSEVFLLPYLRFLLDNWELKFNPRIDDAEFVIPAGLSPEPERIDTSMKTLNRIADGIFHLGTGETYSLFVDAGNYIVGVGGQKDAAARFEDFKTATGLDKPLGYQIISIHHDEHIAGIEDLNKYGPTLVIVDDNVQTIRDAVAETLPDDRFLIVNQMLELGTDGPNPVQIYEISTSYVDRYLLFYLPAQKLVYFSDHLDTPYADTMPPGHLSTVEFAQEIGRLGLDIETFASAGSPRLMTPVDLKLALSKYSPVPCHFDRPICSYAPVER